MRAVFPACHPEGNKAWDAAVSYIQAIPPEGFLLVAHMISAKTGVLLSPALRRIARHAAALQPVCTAASAAAAEPDSRKPVCLVIGAGAGIGQAVARKFAKEGFHACVVSRSSTGPRMMWRCAGD